MTKPDNLAGITEAATKALTDIADKTAAGVTLKFEAIPVTGLKHDPNLVISCAVDHFKETAKMIFHVKNISANNMDVLGKAMYDYCLKVLHSLPSNVRVEASESPLYRSQWDFIVWGVPNLRANELKATAIKWMKDALVKANA